jgi:hypothetical protein
MGFVDVWLGERIPFSLDRVRLYPLFTPDLLDLMRRALPPDRSTRQVPTTIRSGGVDWRKPACSSSKSIVLMQSASPLPSGR